MKKLLDPVDVANDIKMTRSQFKGSFLVVEGESADIKLYKRFTDQEHCQITPAHGKPNLIKIFNILENEGFPGICGLVDPDFDRIQSINHSQNIVSTDCHDQETMVLSSPAFEKILTEYGSEQKIKLFESKNNMSVREYLIKEGAHIGALRLLSINNSQNLKFEGLDFKKFVNQDSLKIDILMLIQEVTNKTSGHKYDKLLFTKKHICDLVTKNDPWSLACGPDILNILNIGLKKALGSRTITPDILATSLRLGYEQSYFESSELHKALKCWEGSNSPFKILL